MIAPKNPPEIPPGTPPDCLLGIYQGFFKVFPGTPDFLPGFFTRLFYGLLLRFFSRNSFQDSCRGPSLIPLRDNFKDFSRFCLGISSQILSENLLGILSRIPLVNSSEIFPGYALDFFSEIPSGIYPEFLLGFLFQDFLQYLFRDSSRDFIWDSFRDFF